MRIDPKTLPPEYQRQVADKLLQEMREKAAIRPVDERNGKRKYNNTPATRKGTQGREIRFDSTKEARRFDQLLLLLRAGEIRDLKLQPEYTLVEAYTTPDGVRVRPMRYRADFSYFRADKPGTSSAAGWRLVVEDVKSHATKTREYRLKKKLLMERFKVEITEVFDV